MEIRKFLKEYPIVGIISNYKVNLEFSGKIKDLDIKDLNKGLKIVGLTEEILDKELEELTISEIWKVDLLTKIHKDIIIVGNLSNDLIFKDREYMKKLFIKLNRDYDKKIIVIDNKVDIFMNLAKKIYVLNNKKIVYETSDFFDDKLYNYVKMPKIVEFIKYTNNDQNKLIETIDIYELIKDIYREVS